MNQDRAGEVKAMEKFFNITGPCDPGRHYMLPPKERLINAQLDKYISGQLYWVLHAPRRTGKTTFLVTYMKEINESDEGIACYVSLERAQGLNVYRGDVRKLARQHTEAAGQQFADEALELVWEETKGQPWLANALLLKCIWTICPDGKTVTDDHIREAREMLITERAVHLDSLQERLKDPRIKRIVQPVITGQMDINLTDGDDFQLAVDVGLVEKAITA